MKRLSTVIATTWNEVVLYDVFETADQPDCRNQWLNSLRAINLGEKKKTKTETINA